MQARVRVYADKTLIQGCIIDNIHKHIVWKLHCLPRQITKHACMLTHSLLIAIRWNLPPTCRRFMGEDRQTTLSTWKLFKPWIYQVYKVNDTLFVILNFEFWIEEFFPVYSVWPFVLFHTFCLLLLFGAHIFEFLNTFGLLLDVDWDIILRVECWSKIGSPSTWPWLEQTGRIVLLHVTRRLVAQLRNCWESQYKVGYSASGKIQANVFRYWNWWPSRRS